MNPCDLVATLPLPADSPADPLTLLATAFSSSLARPLPVRQYRPAEEVTRNPKIMIVDDEAINVKLLRKFLAAEGYKDFITITDSTQAVDLIQQLEPDVVLLDIMMPEVSGLDILKKVREDERFVGLPIVMVTAADDVETKRQALALGATEFLGKPVDVVELLTRIRNALIVKAHHDHLKNYADELECQVTIRTAELAQTQLDVIYCLARAGEFRDDDTGRHILRVGLYAGIIAQQLGFSLQMVQTVQHAAILHDIGKIGIPDAILLKAGKLDPGEWEVMHRHPDYGQNVCDSALDRHWEVYQSHTRTGARIVRGAVSPILQMAGRIANSHHEKWNGSGYPCGLAGEKIPIEGRIVAVADVFDALSSKRPYKPAFPLAKCLEIMEESRGTHFDPAVLDAFFQRLSDITAIQASLADPHQAP